MIKIIKGDLLESNCNVIGHQSNCFSTMGSGIAEQIAKKYPGAYEADKMFPFSPKERLGKTSYWTDGEIAVFNLYGQFRYGRDKRHTEYSPLAYAMLEMLRTVERMEEEDPNFKAIIGLPYKIGCDRAGGEWEKVYKIINKIFVEIGNRDIYLLKIR